MKRTYVILIVLALIAVGIYIWYKNKPKPKPNTTTTPAPTTGGAGVGGALPIKYSPIKTAQLLNADGTPNLDSGLLAYSGVWIRPSGGFELISSYVIQNPKIVGNLVEFELQPKEPSTWGIPNLPFKTYVKLSDLKTV